ncbi:ABC transporter permease [Clostridium sporogenes]|uniref:ABC transporter permease n=1 Tax=Clostridium TaxID=1485 RepID=UPI0006ABCC87|nr:MULTISPECIES: ABC transporter permease [Clostridium]KOR26943.1 membrane protein [Clostridium sp. L74]NFV13207.1 ABC transporter permease [Clostridium sporogenes]
MDFSIRRVNALVKKEMKDFVKNINVSIMYLIPIALSIFYSRVSNISNEAMVKRTLLIVCVGMNISFISSMVVSMMIAEEKEKNTLRTLMLSSVSPWEFLTGKAIIIIFISEIVNIAMLFILGFDAKYLVKYVLITSLLLLSMIEIGAIVGVFCKNQMATGIFSMPVILIFYVIPMAAKMNKIIEKVANLLPNYHMNIMLSSLFKGESVFSKSRYGLVVMLGWIIIAAFAFGWIYKKRGLDK